MSDNEEDNYCFYGKPLEQYDEDSIPKKRPISIEDQVARDEQGRRRFHGAFTGGFSAGFYNTVGSLEGWKPSEFKSSRTEKAGNNLQKPEDYMDDEDIGEFGIKPQKIQATKDYNTTKKRKRPVFSDGPIPGEPVLQTLIESGNDTIGYLLLRNMGFKHTVEEEEDEDEPSTRVYGCEMPKVLPVDKSALQSNVKIPEIYVNALKTPKSNTFGLSYIGLDKTSTKMYKKSNLIMTDRNNKKLSIAGQAFGVGAFEEDDDDIYVREDMSNYDFELTSEIKKLPTVQTSSLIHNLFVRSKKTLVLNEIFPPPTIPNSFTGKHKIKKSRFEPIEEEKQAPKVDKLNADIRARYLGEIGESSKENVADKETSKITEVNNVVEDNEERIGSINNVKNEEPSLGSGSKWGSIAGLVFDRFVSAGKSEEHLNPLDPVERMETTHGTKDMREASRMKMFGPLTRITIDWTPASLICKRFNIPEPVYSDNELKVQRKERKRNLIFENEKYIEPTLTTIETGLKIQTSTHPDVAKTTKTDTLVFESEKEIPNSEVALDATKTNEEPQTTTIEITDKIDVAKNINLYKLIFQDSDESDDNAEENEVSKEENKINQKEIEEEKRARNEIFKQQILTDDFLPKIKPLKEGILSNITLSTFAQPKPLIPNSESQTIQKMVSNEVENTKKDNLFGPQLPTVIKNSVDKKLDYVQISDDEWVERNDDNDTNSDSDESCKIRVKKQKNKHKKKHKKEKRKKKHKRKK